MLFLHQQRENVHVMRARTAMNVNMGFTTRTAAAPGGAAAQFDTAAYTDVRGQAQDLGSELVIMPSQNFAINAWIGSCNIGLDPAICGGGRRPRSTVGGGRSQRSVKGRDAIDARGELAGTAPIWACG